MRSDGVVEKRDVVTVDGVDKGPEAITEASRRHGPLRGLPEPEAWTSKGQLHFT